MSQSLESNIKQRENVRNVAIIAHVDHGKTTLIDALLKETGVLQSGGQTCVMDSNDLERERGITIFSKCASFVHNGVQFNIVDTPGHADFGSEVERILKMVDCALLLVDAREGPMPQTKFVLRKSLALGLRPIVVVNKMDRPDARPDEVVNLTFDLFSDLGANDDQMDFPIIYCSGREGYAMMDPKGERKGMQALLDLIRKHVPPPQGDEEAPLQMLITMLDYDSYVGRIAIGRIHNGKLSVGSQYTLIRGDEVLGTERITRIMSFQGLRRVEVPFAVSGDIVAVAGFADAKVGATIAGGQNPQALQAPKIDEPTISMVFGPNTSPLAGKDGAQYLTSRQIRERLLREAETNVGLRVEPVEKSERIKVSGRGELHLSILIETMRREGYEFEVSRPEVIFKTIDGKRNEPVEHLVVDVETEFQGPVMEELGKRRAEILHMETSISGLNTIMEFMVPSRALLGFRNLFLTLTRGTGIMNHAFREYQPFKGDIPQRKAGVQISMSGGVSVTYGLHGLQERGPLLIGAGVPIYEGMVIGISNKGNDMVVNAARTKKLTNMRATGSDEALLLEPPLMFTLEDSLNFIGDDELVEVTPKNIRIRKKLLSEASRRQQNRSEKSTGE